MSRPGASRSAPLLLVFLLLRRAAAGFNVTDLLEPPRTAAAAASSPPHTVHAAYYYSDGFMRRIHCGTRAQLSVHSLHWRVDRTQSSSSYIKVEKDATYEITIGWHVMPQLTGDDLTNFFVYWKNHNHDSGCFNLQCPGYKPSPSARLKPGDILNRVSDPNGYKVFLTLAIMKDDNGNWSIYEGENQTLVGTLPSSLFDNNFKKITKMKWGGSVGYQFKGPPMGNGYMGSDKSLKAAYITDIKFFDDGGKPYTPPTLQFSRLGDEKSGCYDTSDMRFEFEGMNAGFFYGGPAGCT